MSYVIVGFLGATLAMGYWWGIQKIFISQDSNMPKPSTEQTPAVKETIEQAEENKEPATPPKTTKGVIMKRTYGAKVENVSGFDVGVEVQDSKDVDLKNIESNSRENKNTTTSKKENKIKEEKEELKLLIKRATIEIDNLIISQDLLLKKINSNKDNIEKIFSLNQIREPSMFYSLLSSEILLKHCMFCIQIFSYSQHNIHSSMSIIMDANKSVVDRLDALNGNYLDSNHAKKQLELSWLFINGDIDIKEFMKTNNNLVEKLVKRDPSLHKRRLYDLGD